MLAQYRELADGPGGPGRAAARRGFAGAPADAIATLLGAVGDGLLLHALLDPGLDVRTSARRAAGAARTEAFLSPGSRELADLDEVTVGVPQVTASRDPVGGRGEELRAAAAP